MRQVQRPAARTKKPASDIRPAHPALRPLVWSWLARLDPATDPWPRSTSRTGVRKPGQAIRTRHHAHTPY